MRSFSLRSSLLIILVALCVVVAAWKYDAFASQSSVVASTDLRDTSVDLQQARQWHHRLLEGKEDSLLDVLGEEISLTQIRLANHLSGQANSALNGVVDYEQSLLQPDRVRVSQPMLAMPASDTLSVIRLDFTAQLSNGADFISLLGQLGKVIGGWPFTINGCSITRLPMQILQARCVVDIFHWQPLINSDVVTTNG